MATLPLAIDDTIIQESIIESQFTGQIFDKVKFYDYEAIIPSIRAAAWFLTGLKDEKSVTSFVKKCITNTR